MMNKQTMHFGMAKADLESAKKQLEDRLKGIETPLNPVLHNVERALENIDLLQNDFYTLDAVQFKSCLEAVFKNGWRMRMNRKSDELEATMDNCITLMFLEIDKALDKSKPGAASPS